MYDLLAILGTAGMLALAFIILAIATTVYDNRRHIIRHADKR